MRPFPLNPRSLAVLAAGTLAACGTAWAADCANGSNAAGTCTVPPGMGTVTIEAWGGGGAGNGGPVSAGGGGASYCKATYAVRQAPHSR